MPGAITKAVRVKCRMFEGSFHDAAGAPTTSVRWATAALALPDGPVEGRLRVAPRTSYGIGEAISSVPERAQATLELINADRAISRYVVGTASGNPAQEYRGDSLLNLRGRIYACYLYEDGSYDKHALTPTMCVSGAPTITETTIVLPLSSDDSRILGKPRPIVRVAQLRNAEVLEYGDKLGLNGATRTFDASDWVKFSDAANERGGDAIPYAYGRVAIPLAEVGTDGVYKFYTLFVSKNRPHLSDASRWDFRGPADTPDDSPLAGPVWSRERFRANIYSIKIRVTNEDETTADVWLVWIDYNPTAEAEENSTPTWALPPPGNRLSAGSSPARRSSAPPALARYIVEDLSEAGVVGIHDASFTAAARALPLVGACGGLVTGDGELRELLTLIGAPWGLSWWMGLDDRLHVGVPGQWTAADRAALADPATPRIRWPADSASGAAPGSYEETIPADPEQRGAAVRKVSLEWSDTQRAVWPADQLPRWAPGATELPIQSRDEARLSASWLYPPSAIDVLASSGARRVFPTRRITLHMHDWIGVVERGALVLFSYKLAAPGEYVERVLRLEHTADDSREYVVARFEDLGPTAAAMPAVYADIEDWLLVSAATHASTLSVTAGSDIVTLGKEWSDPPKLVGMHLVTPGAHPANRRIARRIVEGIDSTHFRVEYPFEYTQTLPSAAPGTAPLDCPWAILYSQETRPDNTTELTCADESTGAFRDGSPGFTVGAG
jgi:hypothetical protein